MRSPAAEALAIIDTPDAIQRLLHLVGNAKKPDATEVLLATLSHSKSEQVSKFLLDRLTLRHWEEGSSCFIKLVVSRGEQVAEVCKILLSQGTPLRNRMLMIDLLEMDFEYIDC